ncbi:protein of unknown function DUF928 [Gloeothece citriformis PCC 7424]|uniref:DUF928 domain-containing protein n=1 Tax=Gloeothece citriformis (strain PCC 7424) TaxID=65393 RepID=B7KC87_GLOC7|nr:DUF928 domain-containing protein [Gloeothece citriformis]ACK70192.1 protein of unknown function DUF928 [Gloeothece citriformis PCC 7424]
MNNRGWLKKQLSLTFFLGLSLTLSGSLFSQTSIAQNTAKANQTRVVFKPPDRGKPKDTVGGASRDGGKCREDSQEISPYLTAVIPAQHPGLTIQEHPKILVYLPNISAEKAFFSLRELSSDGYNQQEHYQTILSLPQASGIITVELPKDAPKLEIGKIYKWSFVVMCNNQLRPDSPVVEGTIERIALNSPLSEQLQKALGLERVALYGQAGLWYDAISSLAQLRQNEPKNLELVTIWQDLLNSQMVELNAIANQPLIQ